MKKIAFLTLALLLLLSLAACGQSPASSSNTTALVGGYTEDREPTDEDLVLFNDAIAIIDTSGVVYQPQKVATQVVAGVNYRFYCQAGDGSFSYVYIFQPLEEGAAPTVTEITDAA